MIDNAAESNDILNKLTVCSSEGKVWFNEQRVMLFSQAALGKFRREVADTLGMRRSKSFFLRLGYQLGMLDGEMARTSDPNVSIEERFKIGPELHALRGMVKPTILESTIPTTKEEKFYCKVLWNNSYEVDISRKELPDLNEPSCWTLSGYASGYSSRFMQREIYFQEMSCEACNDENCIGIGKQAEDWDDIETIRSFYEKDHILSELIELKKHLNDLEGTLAERYALTDVIGQSKPFKHALNMVTKASDSKVSVLLLGETGVGKEVLARALHISSDRKDYPFIAVNCAAIPPDLIESELFGVMKGAFTGANTTREGRFERAHKGTIFLDEVIELSPRAQASLLRVLQEEEFERVGDNQLRKIDVRVVAATNEDLSVAIKQKRFRADLYYRLSAFPVKVPSLRQRKEDIPLFVEFFLNKYSKEYNKKVFGITDKSMDLLTSYHWPGNIRELENVVERALILAEENTYISMDSIIGASVSEKDENSEVEIYNSGNNTSDKNTSKINSSEKLAELVIENDFGLEEIESSILQQALQKANGNVSKAARLAGLSRPAFAYRLKKNPINVETS